MSLEAGRLSCENFAMSKNQTSDYGSSRMQKFRVRFRGYSLALLCFSFAVSDAAGAASLDPETEESMYRNFYLGFTQPGAQPAVAESLSALELRFALDAAEDALLEGILRVDLGLWLPERALGALPAREQVRWFRLRALQDREAIAWAEEARLILRYSAFVNAAAGDIELFLELLRSAPYWRSAAGAELVRSVEASDPEAAARYRASLVGEFAAPDAALVRDLYQELPDLASFQGGNYLRTPRLFLFCRHDRRYPCLFAMKDRDDRPLRRADGSLWTQPALALSVVGLPFSERNGYTPQGVFRIDSVMPAADRPEFFGQFRRLILNFVGRTLGEAELKRALPRTSLDADWWRESVVARDIGRGLFRIHGTGQSNSAPASPYYPLFPPHPLLPPP